MFDYYQISNILESIKVPGAVKLHTNATAAYFARYLTEKAISVFKWDDIPKTWDKDYFLYVLYIMGYVGIINTPEFGVIPQWGTLNGFNVFYAPRKFMVSNPLLKTRDYLIHEECELFKLQGNYMGIFDLVSYYSGKMALAAEAVDMNLINSKSSKIFFAGNKAASESFKKIYDQIAAGNPAVVADKTLLNDEGEIACEWFSENLKQSYIVSDLLIDLRKLENEFCTDLGIPNTNTDKRERLTDDEVNANNVETSTRAELWLERLKDCAERVNSMFSLNISVDWRVKPNDGNSVTMGPVSDGRYDSRRTSVA